MNQTDSDDPEQDSRFEPPRFVFVLLTAWFGIGGALGIGALLAENSADAQATTTDDQTRAPTTTSTTSASDLDASNTDGTTTNGAPGDSGADETDTSDTAVETDSETTDSETTDSDDLPTTVENLGGTHGFTTDLIGWESWGAATVTTNGDGTYGIVGEQRLGNAWLVIDGTLAPQDEATLIFVGEIESQTDAYNGNLCTRFGQMTFEAPEGKQYWRLQEQTNPCGEYVESIDLFFAGL